MMFWDSEVAKRLLAQGALRPLMCSLPALLANKLR